MEDHPSAPDSPTPTARRAASDAIPSSSGDQPPPLPAAAAPPRVLARRIGGGSSYIGSLGEEESSWKTGAAFLCLLFALVCLSEAATVFVDIFNGTEPAGVSRFVLLRAADGALMLVGLWIGWNWLRWIAALTAVGYGLWRVVWSIALNNVAPPVVLNHGVPPPYQPDVQFGVHVSSGVLYIMLGLFLALAGAAVDFTRHRRETKSRTGGIIFAVVASAAYFGLLFAVKPASDAWLQRLQTQALAFGESSLRDMTAEWDPAVYENNMTAAYKAQSWQKESGHAFFASAKKIYGPARTVERTQAPVSVSIDPLGHLSVLSTYKAHVAFEHVSGGYETSLTGGLLVPWTQGGFTIADDPKPAPPPPAPGAAPAVPAVPGASPAAPGALPAPVDAVPAAGTVPLPQTTVVPPTQTTLPVPPAATASPRLVQVMPAATPTPAKK